MDSFKSSSETNMDDHDDTTEQADTWYDPAESSAELDDLMKSLGNETEENLQFKYELSEEYQNEIGVLHSEMEGFNPVSNYLDEFDQVVKDDMLLIGSLSMQELEIEEQRIKKEHINLQQKQISLLQEQKEDVTKLTESAKKRIWLDSKQQQKDATIRDEVLTKREKLLNEQMQKAFRQSESQLQRALELRQADVKSFYGKLLLADNQYGGSKGRRWRVEWTKTPQPIQIKVVSVRGIRDKIPAGRYALMVSLYDRLGGHALRWSKLAGQQWGGATFPVYHDGHFASSEMSIDQSMFTVLPPQRKVQPGMILAFELFLLRGAVSPTDKVVAWGCFPICDGQFQIIQGCYKLPLLRGFMDHRITKHSTIEQLIATDIDHWIANLYIQIIRLPRYLSGQKEYEVELQFTSGLLSYPDRVFAVEDAADGEKMPQADANDFSVADDTQSTLNSSVALEMKNTSLNFSSTSGVMTGKSSYSDLHSNTPRKRRSVSKVMDKVDDVSLHKHSMDSFDDIVPVKGQPGMFYKLHHNNPADDYTSAQSTRFVPMTPLLHKSTTKPTLTHSEGLGKHTFSVQESFSTKGRMQRRAHEKAEYVLRMFLSEMGFSQWTTQEFWVTILMLILIFFVRLYVHYCGQWLFLQALSLPVSAFVFFPYTVSLNYQSDLLTTGEEIGVVVLGPISNVIIQIILILISWISQLLLGSFPLLFSKFIMAFSLWTIIDPIVILIVDSGLGRYANTASQPIGDAFKLYWHFVRVEGSGVIGIPMTIFLYIVLIFIAVVIIYLYFLKLHNNGRMLDVFHRLHGKEDTFFIPHDLELSNQELSYIVKKAEQWRGANGERRKVSVYDYIWDEDRFDGNNYQEVTIHTAIHTLHLDGLRELYRHFLCLPDGAIVEVFGELGSAHLSPDVKTALLKTSNNIENVIAPSSVNDNISMGNSDYRSEMKKHSLNLPTGGRDRPITSDSLRTRETLRCDSSDSSTDV